MSDEGHEGDIIEDLLLTDTFLVKGVVEGKGQRLSLVLQNQENAFLSIRGAARIDLGSGRSSFFPQLFLRLDQVLLAHEYVDFCRDEVYSSSGERTPVMIQAEIAGPAGITLTGYAARRDLKPPVTTKRFMVLERPRVDFDSISPEVDEDIFADLPYLILNREKISCFYGVTPEKRPAEGDTL